MEMVGFRDVKCVGKTPVKTSSYTVASLFSAKRD